VGKKGAAFFSGLQWDDKGENCAKIRRNNRPGFPGETEVRYGKEQYG
jgi:hypothetical protein